MDATAAYQRAGVGRYLSEARKGGWQHIGKLVDVDG